MKPLLQLLGEHGMNTPMPIDGAEAFERGAHDEHLKMRLGTGRHIVVMTLVLHLEENRREGDGELLLNAFLAGHAASLPRRPSTSSNEPTRTPARSLVLGLQRPR